MTAHEHGGEWWYRAYDVKVEMDEARKQGAEEERKRIWEEYKRLRANHLAEEAAEKAMFFSAPAPPRLPEKLGVGNSTSYYADMCYAINALIDYLKAREPGRGM